MQWLNAKRKGKVLKKKKLKIERAIYLNNDNFLQLFSAREPSMKNLLTDGIPISTLVLMAFKIIDQKLQARVPKLPSFTYAIH
jgi:hypothetical protein